MIKKWFYSIFLFSAFLVSLFGCSSSDVTKLKSAEEVFNKAMELFNDEDYLEAKTQFDNIKLQYPASQYADDAQYYQAECNFIREEYILAAYNYNLLRRVYPNSEYVKESFFKSGICYYYLAPQFDRDQEYTLRAIKTMSEFQQVYPSDSLTLIINANIQELRNRLGEREFSIAELYRKLLSPNAALIYYESVIEQYYDTKFYEPAFVGKIEVLIEMKKWEKARNTIDTYYTTFKDGTLTERVKELERSLPAE